MGNIGRRSIKLRVVLFGYTDSAAYLFEVLMNDKKLVQEGRR
jgi:hypothetical protein